MKTLSILFLLFLFAFKSTGQSPLSAERFFNDNYKKKHFSKFSGTIRKIDQYTTKFDQKCIIVLNPEPEFDFIILKGLLYPSLFSEDIDSVRITNLKEIKNSSSSTKRYSFWVFFKGFANPIIAYIELTNPYKLKRKNAWEFIKNSSLTFFMISREVII